MGYYMSQTSLAHTYGNIASFMTEYIKNMFPPDYFKTVAITSTIAYKQFDQLKNKEQDYFRRSKPKLIVRPRIELNDSETFLYNTLLTTNLYGRYLGNGESNLQDFIYDNERGNRVKFLLNRLKMYFDVTIAVETKMEQLNTAHYFNNIICTDVPYFLSTCLESYVPRELFKIMGDDVGIPLYDENGSVKPFLDYVNSVSSYPVSYKLKHSSGNDEFFRFYPVNLDVVMSNLSIEDGEKKGFIDYEHRINFTYSVEFSAAGLYYYFSENPLELDQYNTMLSVPQSDYIIPMYTVDNLYTKRYAEGWNLYAAPIYKVDSDASSENPDVMDIEPLLNNSMKAIIDYHKKHGVPETVYLKIFVMKNSEILDEGIDYELDLNTYELITYNIDEEASYRLIIHTNTFYINNLLKDIYGLDENE